MHCQRNSCDPAAIKAPGDDSAISEAKAYGPVGNPLWFELRKVGKKSNEVIYSSKVKA